MGLIMGGLSLLSAGASMYQQGQEAKAAQSAQDEYNAAIKEQTHENLREVTAAKADTLENQAADKLQNRIDRLSAQSSNTVAGNAMGMAGQSFGQIMQDADNAYLQRDIDIDKSTSDNLRNLEIQSDNVLRGGESALDNRTISKPNYISGGISAIGSGIQGYKAGESLRSSYNDYRSVN